MRVCVVSPYVQMEAVVTKLCRYSFTVTTRTKRYALPGRCASVSKAFRVYWMSESAEKMMRASPNSKFSCTGNELPQWDCPSRM
jgi:hypothetical protein